MTVFAKRLRKLRMDKKKKDSKYTQEYVANLINVARSTYTAYEAGTKQPPMETVIKIADLFGVTTDYLLGRTDDQLPKLTKKDERDIAKKLESILESMNSNTALVFHGEPMDEETKDLVKEAILYNLRLTKRLAKAKFTPKKYRQNNTANSSKE